MESRISVEIKSLVSEVMEMMWSETGPTLVDSLYHEYEPELRCKLRDTGYCPVKARKCILYALIWKITTLAGNDQDLREFIWEYLIKEHSKRDPDGIPSEESWKSSIEIYKQFRDQFSFNLFEMLMGAQTGWEKADNLLLDYPRFQMEYDNLGKIGKGGFGSVYKVTNKLDGRSYALKSIPYRHETLEALAIIMREIQILVALKPHPNLIAYKTSWMESFIVSGKSNVSKVAGIAVPTPKTAHSNTEPAEALETTETTGESSTPSGSQQKSHHDLTYGVSLYILTELCGKNLKTWMEERIVELRKMASEDGRTKSLLDHIDANECLNIFRQILIGVKVIHDNHVIHRDLKPENILLGLDGIWKIGDFGLATIDQYVNASASLTQALGTVQTVGLGTSAYAAPEQLKKGVDPYNRKVDIFSVGMLAFELFHPFGTYTEREKAFGNLRNDQSLPKALTTSFPKLAKILLQMTSFSPNDRPDAVEILQSELFSNDGHKELDDHSEYLLVPKPQLSQKDAEIRRMQEEIEKRDIKIRKLIEKIRILQDGGQNLDSTISPLTEK